MVAMIREQISPYVAAGWSFIDDLIDPADTRRVVVPRASSRPPARGWSDRGESTACSPCERLGLRPEQAVSEVSEARQDVSALVELSIQ